MPANSRTPGGTQTYSKRRHAGPAHDAFANSAVNYWTWDTTGRRWLDFCAGLGPIILGHRYPDVEAAVQRQMGKGTCFSLPTRLEEQVAELLAAHIPCAEMTRFLKNGADALEAAVRVARAVTGRDLVFRCGYHGMHDWCIDSRGIPQAIRDLTVAFSHGQSLTHVRLTLPAKYGDAIPAAVVIEPIKAQTGIYPEPEYLASLRQWCDQHGTLLIFDEVVTGFRMDLGGAQKYFGVTPDLACFSKAMANGYPISALCGKAELMREIEHGVFVSTTFGGDPVALAATRATITTLADEQVLSKLAQLGEQLRTSYHSAASSLQLDTRLVGYPQRLLAKWQNSAQEAAFNMAVAGAGVLAPGYYNLMYAHYLQQETVLHQLTEAWAQGFNAARAIA